MSDFDRARVRRRQRPPCHAGHEQRRRNTCSPQHRQLARGGGFVGRVGAFLGVLFEPVAQLARQRAGRAVAVFGVLLHRPRRDVGQRLGHGRIDLVRRRRYELDHGVGDFLQRGTAEGARPGQQLIQHHAEREHVAPAVHRLLAHLLGGHVVGRAAGDVALGVLMLVGDAGNAEVEHTRLGAAHHEDVGGLDVAVDHALRMRVGQRIGHPAHHQRGLRRRGLPAFEAQLAQVAALQQLHRDVGALLAHAGIEHRHDVRVAQATGGTCFVQEQGVERLALIGGDLEVQRLDGNQARQQRVVRGVHAAEAAFADLVLEGIAADVADGGQLVRRLVGRIGVERRCGLRRQAAQIGVAPGRRVGCGGHAIRDGRSRFRG